MYRRRKVDEKSCVTPTGISNELDVQNKWEENTHTHTQVSLIPPWEDQCEWHRMTRMTRPDCAVMCNLINTHTHTHHTAIGADSRKHKERYDITTDEEWYILAKV